MDINKINNFFNPIYFLYIYLISAFLELFFNREFLVSVLPFGLAGISVSKVEPYLTAFYIIGGVAFTFLLILQPVFLVWAILKIKQKLGRILLASVLYLTLFADFMHIAYGVNNTAFQLPAVYSIIYVTLIIGSSLLLIKGKNILYALFIPDILAYSFLLFNWLAQFLRASWIGIISGYSGYLMAYAVLAAGVIFISWAVRKVRIVRILPFVAIGLFVGIASWLNLIPGWDFAIGVAFPYVFGILGIRDWMPPIFFVIAFITFGYALCLRKLDKPLSFSVLALLAATLVFDSVPITLYLISPLVAVTYLYLTPVRQKLKE
ncbi:hypothetical protein [Acidianus sp. HS-5]|uniref:hypothetical protein n=1 Tax=Acidianus sp. HS-5 TaxID=2886040 RepID=UPI001F27EBE1|nr:hypothetical protein [Acidianus sp. HS-5]BDC17674.1 hypothetical protein HS5_05640 [Acidianus sp. HS-5]